MSGVRPYAATGADADRRAAHLGTFLPALMLVVNTADAPDLGIVRAAVEGGVTMVQVRHRRNSSGDGDHGRVASEVHRLIDDRALMLLNDSSGATAHAMAPGAAMHLPEPAPGVHRPPLSAIRERLGQSVIVSCAVHSVEAALDAEGRGADMLVLGTVFSSTSHPGGPTIGLDGVRAVCAAVRMPVIGIGGITAQNAGDVMAAGAAGVAVISAIFEAPDPAAAATELHAAIGTGLEAR